MTLPDFMQYLLFALFQLVWFYSKSTFSKLFSKETRGNFCIKVFRNSLAMVCPDLIGKKESHD